MPASCDSNPDHPHPRDCISSHHLRCYFGCRAGHSPGSRGLVGDALSAGSVLYRGPARFPVHGSSVDCHAGEHRRTSDARVWRMNFGGIEPPDALDRRALRRLGVARPAPQPERNFLTIGMATYDDYDGCYFSVQAIRLYHSEILSEVEFLVVDNKPAGPCSQALKSLEN